MSFGELSVQPVRICDFGLSVTFVVCIKVSYSLIHSFNTFIVHLMIIRENKSAHLKLTLPVKPAIRLWVF